MPSKKRPPSDPDIAFRSLDDVGQMRFLLLRSSKAEELFARYFLNIELSPYQVFIVKLMRGCFLTEADARQFIADNDLEFMYDTGNIRFASDTHGRLFPNNEILLPAGHGKTTLVRLFCDMEACDNPNSRNQLIFKNLHEGHATSSVVRQDLTMPKMVELFGDPVPRDGAWSNDRFSLAQRTWGDVRDNFEFYGTNSDAALGKRSDRVTSDDCETPETARTVDACQKLIEWFDTGPMTSAKPLWTKDAYGRVNIPKALDWPERLYWGHTNLGTIFHPAGLHATLANNPTYNYVRLDCFRDRKQTIPLDYRMMSIDELEAKRRGNLLAFNRRYRNIAVDPREMSFQEVWLRGGDAMTESGKRIHYDGCLDEGRSYGEYDDTWTLYMGYDPATGSKTRFAAYSAFVVVGQPPDSEKIYVVDFLKDQIDYSRQIDYLLEGNPDYGIEGFLKKYPISLCTLEKNNHGMMFTGDDRVRPWIDRGIIVPSYTGNNKLEPETGIPALGPLVEHGNLRIPYKDAADKNKSEILLVDMLEFHPVRNKCDLVMALWLATIPARQPKNQYRSFFGPGGRPLSGIRR